MNLVLIMLITDLVIIKCVRDHLHTFFIKNHKSLGVGNGSHFCTPILMNLCNITFQVLRLSTFVFNKCSEKIIFKNIFVVKSL